MTNLIDHIGPIFRGTDYAEHTKTTVQDLNNQVNNGSLIGIVSRDGTLGLPAYQFNKDGSVCSWVISAFNVYDKTHQNHLKFSLWVTQPSPLLGNKKPIDMLRKGLFAPVFALITR